MKTFFESLSVPDLLRSIKCCQDRANNNLSCNGCTYGKRGLCAGRYEKEQDRLYKDLMLEQTEQM